MYTCTHTHTHQTCRALQSAGRNLRIANVLRRRSSQASGRTRLPCRSFAWWEPFDLTGWPMLSREWKLQASKCTKKLPLACLTITISANLVWLETFVNAEGLSFCIHIWCIWFFQNTYSVYIGCMLKRSWVQSMLRSEPSLLRSPLRRQGQPLQCSLYSAQG